MNLGPLNRRGVLYRNDPVAGDGAAPVDALTPLRNLGLTVVEPTQGDADTAALVAERVTGSAEIQWKSRWFEGLEAEMFIVFEGSTFRVTSRRELGRRDGWLISGLQIR